MLKQSIHHWLLATTLGAIINVNASADTLPNNYIDAGLQADATGWELKEEKEGITVSTKKIPGSGIKAFKGEYIMQASMGSIMAAMADPITCKEWVHGCAKVENLGSDNPEEFFQYGVNDLPWPAKDRDYIIRSTHTVSDNDELLIELTAQPTTLPESDSYVRLTHMLIHYQIKALDDDSTHVVWTQHTEPNGLIPSWMVNMLLVDIPFYSLTRLEDLAQSDEYKNEPFDLGAVRRGEPQPHLDAAEPQTANAEDALPEN